MITIQLHFIILITYNVIIYLLDYLLMDFYYSSVCFLSYISWALVKLLFIFIIVIIFIIDDRLSESL